jgi:Ca2+-binding EF-hand superfamily protein
LHLQDESGELDRSELATLYKQARGEKLSGRQLKTAMAVMDADKSGTIEFSEFEAWSVPAALLSL